MLSIKVILIIGNKYLNYRCVVLIGVPMPRILHVCFDCDGTLYDTPKEFTEHLEGIICREISKRKRINESVVRKEYKTMREAKKTHIEAITSYGIAPQEAQAIYGDISPEELLGPDTILRDMLLKLKDDVIGRSIFTNSQPVKLVGILKKLGVADMFDFLFTSGVVPAKPDIDGFRAIYTHAKCAPGAVLYAGDNERADTIPARYAGMNTFLKSSESSYFFDDINKTHHFKRNTIYEITNVIEEIGRFNE